MSSDNCIFCKMVAGRISTNKVYEDNVVLAFLDIAPISDGHTLLIPKEHFTNLEDCPAEMAGKVCSRLGLVAGAVKTAMKADGYNVLCNRGRAAGQLVEHLHFHIIPRESGDGVFDKWPSYKYQDGQAEQIAEKIRSQI